MFWKTEDDLIVFQMEEDLIFVLGNPRIWFSVCNLIFTQLDELWKTTQYFENGRWPQLFQMEDNINIIYYVTYTYINARYNCFSWLDDTTILIVGIVG